MSSKFIIEPNQVRKVDISNFVILLEGIDLAEALSKTVFLISKVANMLTLQADSTGHEQSSSKQEDERVKRVEQ